MPNGRTERGYCLGQELRKNSSRCGLERRSPGTHSTPFQPDSFPDYDARRMIAFPLIHDYVQFVSFYDYPYLMRFRETFPCDTQGCVHTSSSEDRRNCRDSFLLYRTDGCFAKGLHVCLFAVPSRKLPFEIAILEPR